MLMSFTRHLLYTFFLLSANLVFAQNGGQHSFEFVQMPFDAKVASLGGVNVSAYNEDVSMFLYNPSLLTSQEHQQLAFSYIDYFTSTGSQVVYSYSLPNDFQLGFGALYLDQGTIPGYDEVGNPTGSFNASDALITLGLSHKLSFFSMGVNLKYAQTAIEQYRSSALMFDIGGTFTHPTKDLTLGLVFSNFGFAFSNFVSEELSTPFDITAGMTFKPEKMPVRFSVTYKQFNNFDIAYDDPKDDNQDNGLGEQTDNTVGFADKLARHFIVGGEFVLGKVLNLRMGYNIQRRQEISHEDRRGLSGFSFGGDLKFSNWRITYANAVYHQAGATNTLTLSVNTASFSKKKRKKVVVE
ncbi:type IX secretion system protein PorQ [Sediminitomix flava]|nr:type IX secretion system protein PorQ [Sediminitomix flava]